MAKASYYGIATKEQVAAKQKALGHPEINTQELTRDSIYSAMAQIPNFEQLSVSVLSDRIAKILKDRGFNGKLTTPGGKISDGVNTFALTKSKTDGVIIGDEKHDDLKRNKR